MTRPAGVLLALGLALAAPGSVAAAPLPPLGADLRGLTVSGISSGGYMAVQFQVAHSQLVRGAGVIAGGPYYCAQGSTFRALQNCMAPGTWTPLPTPAQLRATVETLATAKRIDAVSHLRDDRVWLLSGGADHTVERPVMDLLAAFYAEWLPAASIRYLKPPDAGHAMISAIDPGANACGTSDPPYINRCADPEGPGSLDAPGKLLAHLQGSPLEAPTDPTGEVLAFEQQPHVGSQAADAGLAELGYAYVPKSCRGGGCRVHVAFHGCRQSAVLIGRRFVDGAGYNRWAEGNRLIVLYPQTAPRSGFAAGSWKWIYNPKACWDWWGYSGVDYHTRDGIQIKAVKSMIDRLAQPPRP